MKDIAIIFDCGATNLRVVAINQNGTIEAKQTFVNNTIEDPYLKGGKIWDIDEIWHKLKEASKHVISRIDKNRIAGVSVTTFGVDGTFIDRNGSLLYPVISWQCERTLPIINRINEYISAEKLYAISGIFPYAINTINKLIWIKENYPGIIDKASDFLFISSLLVYKLSGQRITNSTMAGTSMLTDIRTRGLSKEILQTLGISPEIFPPVKEAGEQAGEITSHTAEETGIPTGIPVYVTGHDTQFAIFGSGAQSGSPVLSSGTWEILMSRSNTFRTEEKQRDLGITTELDAIPGYYDIGLNWMGSGPLEWIREHFFANNGEKEDYEDIINEASKIKPGCNGVRINPDFINAQKTQYPSGIFGLNLHTGRAEIYRAALEALACKLKKGLHALEDTGNFTTSEITCVGGGSKNTLWNQIRADMCNAPIRLIGQKETTVLGAALFVFAASGNFQNPAEALQHIDYSPHIIYPSENTEMYQEIYESYHPYI